MSEEKAITKSYLEEAIHEKAVRHWEQESKRICDVLQNSPFIDSEIPVKSSYAMKDHVALRDYNISYPHNCEAILEDLFEDYDKIKKQTIKEYEQDETEKLLNNLSGISDFLDDEEHENED